MNTRNEPGTLGNSIVCAYVLIDKYHNDVGNKSRKYTNRRESGGGVHRRDGTIDSWVISNSALFADKYKKFV